MNRRFVITTLAVATVAVVAVILLARSAPHQAPDQVATGSSLESPDIMATTPSEAESSFSRAPTRGPRVTDRRSASRSYVIEPFETGEPIDADAPRAAPVPSSSSARAADSWAPLAPTATPSPSVRGLSPRDSYGSRSTRGLEGENRSTLAPDTIPGETATAARNTRRGAGAVRYEGHTPLPAAGTATELWTGNELLASDALCSAEAYPFPFRQRTTPTTSRRLEDQVISSIGEQRVAVLVAYSEYSERPNKSRADLHDEILSESNSRSLASYYRAVSFGRMWLSGNVYGAYEVPGARFSFDFIKGAIEAAERAGDVNWEEVDRLYVLVPPSNGTLNNFRPMAAFGNSWNPAVDLPGGRKVTAAITMIDERSMGVPVQPEAGSYSGAGRHEFGHTLGWGHQGRMRCEENIAYAPDHACPVTTGGVNLGGISMGRGRMPSGLELEAVGWTNHERIHVVDRPGTYIISLAPLSLTEGTHIVRIPRDEEGRFYTLEYRRPVGAFEPDLFEQSAFPVAQRVDLDGVFFSIEGEILEGHGLLSSITLDVVRGDGYRDAYETCLPVGKTFTCPVFGSTVTLLDANDDRALLRVSAPSIPVIEMSTDGDLEWTELADMLVDPKLAEDAIEALLGNDWDTGEDGE